MYTYPSGLRCRASARRARNYEIFIKFFEVSLMIIGGVVIGKYFLQGSHAILTILEAVFFFAGWLLVCGALGGIAFIFWCQPLDSYDESEDN